MNGVVAPSRLPLWVALAPFAPTLLVVALYITRFLHLVAWDWDVRVVAFVWLSTTSAIAFLAVGLRRMDERWRPGPDPEVASAIEALEAATATLARAREVFDQIQQDTSEADRTTADAGGHSRRGK